jgi:hypothetical protein
MERLNALSKSYYRGADGVSISRIITTIISKDIATW